MDRSGGGAGHHQHHRVVDHDVGGVAPRTTPTTASTATTATPQPASEETRTYNVVGGSVALRFSPSGVTVLWANPNSGFEVEVENEGTGVQVDFESESHRSRVEGWWDGGPQDRVREDAGGDD